MTKCTLENLNEKWSIFKHVCTKAVDSIWWNSQSNQGFHIQRKVKLELKTNYPGLIAGIVIINVCQLWDSSFANLIFIVYLFTRRHAHYEAMGKRLQICFHNLFFFKKKKRCVSVIGIPLWSKTDKVNSTSIRLYLVKYK